METNINCWLSSDIIEQDLTVVIRFFNLRFEFGLVVALLGRLTLDRDI